MTAVLFDLFGTLVHYSPSRTEQSYLAADELLRSAGLRRGYDEWLADLDDVFAEHDRRSAADLSEFSMHEVATSFLPRVGLPESPDLVDGFVDQYLSGWSAPVEPVSGAAAMLGRLRGDGHTLVLVSNTHSVALVQGLLGRFGFGEHFTATVLSVEEGVRKPHPDIYRRALAAASDGPEQAVFVGDTFDADYEGPSAQGITAFLIGTDARVPATRQLASVVDLEQRLPELA